MPSKTDKATDKGIRAVHVALQQTIQVKGSAAAKRLAERYAEYNAEHFEGKLGIGCVLITATAPRALGDYIGQDAQGIESRIRIREAIVTGSPQSYQDDVLLHEMVHAWCNEVAHDGEASYRGHGPVFAGKCNEIGRKLGLPEVSPKGRGGKKPCAQWPLCVRPEGYYGDVDHRGRKRDKSADGDEGGEREGKSKGKQPDVAGGLQAAVKALDKARQARTLEAARRAAEAGLEAIQAALAGASDAGASEEGSEVAA